MSTNSKLLAEMQADITALLGVKTLSAEHEAKLRQILSWPHWDDIQTGAQKEYHMSAKQFRSVVIEYWKFMGLIACGYSGLGMFSRDVDKIWHSHILNMPLYQDFCVSVLGYIAQHIPNLKKGKREMSTCCTGSIHCKPGQAALLTCNNPRCVTKCRRPSAT